ncbi:MAG: hypothetical protein IJV71_12160 [Lachnospiraceae bacterium]|nr:hypothetical protein [Lachnospiraceae bacterium]
MRKLEKLEKYVITPNVGFYGGFVYDGQDVFLCDDHDVEGTYDFKVVQKIVDGVLITDITKTYEHTKGKQVREAAHSEVEIEAGQLLVYVEGLGFTISEYKMCTIDEAMDIYGLLKGEIRDDAERSEENSASAN